MTTLLRQVGRPSNIEKAMAKFMVDVADEVQAEQEAQNMVASGASLKSHVVTIKKPNQGQYEAAEYYTFLIKGQGRRKGAKFPPPSDIEDWIKAKGISVPNMTINQLVFLISRKISELGTAITQGSKGIDLDQIILSNIKPFDEAVGDVIATEIGEEMVKAFARMPNTTVVK